MPAHRYPPPDAPGIIYLLHFSASTRQGRQHYLGWTCDLARRYAEHRAGAGCRETSKAVAEGLKLIVAQTWKGTPALEIRLKLWSREDRKSFAGICPMCGGEAVLPADLSEELGAPSMIRVERPPASSL